MFVHCNIHILNCNQYDSETSLYRTMLCMRGASHGPVSVSICLSVTSRHSTKTAKRRITQTTPHNSPGSLVFWCQRPPHKIQLGSPRMGIKCRWGGSKLKIGDFQQITGYISKTVEVDTWFLLKSNRKSYAVYRMVACCGWPWVTPNCPKTPHFLHFTPPLIAL